MVSASGKKYTDFMNFHEKCIKRQQLADSVAQNRTGGGVDQRIDALIEGLVAMEPVRVIRPSRRSVTGWIHSTKGHEPVPFESSLERDCAFQLIYDCRVKFVQSQPLTITFPDDDARNRSYTPDYLVEYEQGGEINKVLIEVKPIKKWKEEEEKLTARYTYAAHWAREKGVGFRLLTDEQIRATRLKNVRTLWPIAMDSADDPDARPDLSISIIHQLPGRNRDIVKAVSAKHSDASEATVQFQILTMIAESFIWCDLDSELLIDAMLYPPDRRDDQPFLFDHGLGF